MLKFPFDVGSSLGSAKAQGLCGCCSASAPRLCNSFVIGLVEARVGFPPLLVIGGDMGLVGEPPCLLTGETLLLSDPQGGLPPLLVRGGFRGRFFDFRVFIRLNVGGQERRALSQ